MDGEGGGGALRDGADAFFVVDCFVVCEESPAAVSDAADASTTNTDEEDAAAVDAASVTVSAPLPSSFSFPLSSLLVCLPFRFFFAGSFPPRSAPTTSVSAENGFS